MTSASSETMPGLLPKSEAKGVDFCGGDEHHHYIVRSDFGCYMRSKDVHKGLKLTIYDLHPSCQGGDHYLASKKKFYIIKGNSYRCVSDMTKDLKAKVYDLHSNCRGGDHYLSANGCFYIVFQSRGVFRKTRDLTTDKEGGEHKLHPNCSDGLYYWGTKNCIYLVKPKGEWGVQFHKTDDLQKDTKANTDSVHPDVLNFLPGGLAETHGSAFERWYLFEGIDNNLETSITCEKKINWKVGYVRSKSSSIEHNWKLSPNLMLQPGTLAEKIIKFQFSLSTEYAVKNINMENESWEELTKVEETVTLPVPPNTKIFMWQYKLGFGKEDFFFCRDLVIDNGPDPPNAPPPLNH